jgi:hypothetical protein
MSPVRASLEVTIQGSDAHIQSMHILTPRKLTAPRCTTRPLVYFQFVVVGTRVLCVCVSADTDARLSLLCAAAGDSVNYRDEILREVRANVIVCCLLLLCVRAFVLPDRTSPLTRVSSFPFPHTHAHDTQIVSTERAYVEGLEILINVRSLPSHACTVAACARALSLGRTEGP